MNKIKITSDGTTHGTKVYSEGVEIKGVQTVMWTVDARDTRGPMVALTFAMSDVDLVGELMQPKR